MCAPVTLPVIFGNTHRPRRGRIYPARNLPIQGNRSLYRQGLAPARPCFANRKFILPTYRTTVGAGFILPETCRHRKIDCYMDEVLLAQDGQGMPCPYGVERKFVRRKVNLSLERMHRKGFSWRRSCHKSALRNRFVTDEVCGRKHILFQDFRRIRAVAQHLIRQPFGLPPSPQGEGFGRIRLFDKFVLSHTTSSVSPSGCHLLLKEKALGASGCSTNSCLTLVNCSAGWARLHLFVSIHTRSA